MLLVGAAPAARAEAGAGVATEQQQASQALSAVDDGAAGGSDDAPAPAVPAAEPTEPTPNAPATPDDAAPAPTEPTSDPDASAATGDPDPADSADPAATDPDNPDPSADPSNDSATDPDPADTSSNASLKLKALLSARGSSGDTTVATSLLDGMVNPLAVGDIFKSISDEGYAVCYRVTGPTTVQLGSGEWLQSADGSLDRLNPTVDPFFSGTLTVPATVTHNGTTYTVTSVGSHAFSFILNYATQYRITGLDLPDTVTSIDSYAFSNNMSLERITYRYGCALTRIGEYAFTRSNALTSFEIPATVTSLAPRVFFESKLQSASFAPGSRISSLPNGFFSSSALTSFTIPEHITSIEDNVFSDCGALRTIAIPATVTSMGEGVFAGCSLLREATFDPRNLMSFIPTRTFFGCASLTSFTFNNTVTRIDRAAFSGSGLTSLEIPARINDFGDSVFANCGSLVSVDFAENHPLMVMSWNMFAGCSKLARVELPPNLRVLGDYSFANCAQLTSISIPATVTSLGEFTFQGCSRLQTLIFEGDANFLMAGYSTFYLCGSLKNVVYWGKASPSLLFISSQPDTYYTISYYQSFAEVGTSAPLARYCVRAYAVPLSATGSEVFSGGIPEPPGNGVRWMYEEGRMVSAEITGSFYAYARSAAPDLVAGEVFIANTIERTPVTYQVISPASDAVPGTVMVGTMLLGEAVATGTMGSITLPTEVIGPDIQRYTVTQIAPNAFKDRANFVTVTIPTTVTNVGASAFQRCSSLRTIFFNGNANTITDQSIFLGCSNIETVVFGGKKANIGFGVSSPDIYYSVRYYQTAHDRDIGNIQATVIVRERALLGALVPADIYSGEVPVLLTGFTWQYEDGFAGDKPLEDSCTVTQEGLGFQVPVLINSAGDTQLCWFRVLSYDEEQARGTVQVGLSIDGLTAVHASTKGVPTIPASVTDADGKAYDVVAIGDYAFGASDALFACQYITSVNVPSSVTSLGVSAFRECHALTNMSLPASIASMGTGVFRNCTNLTSFSIDVRAPLKVIPDYAFYYDELLLTFALPSALEYIGESAFHACRSLRSVTFPPALRELGDAAYFMAYRIRDITFLGDADQFKVGRSALFMDWSITVLAQVASVNYMGKMKPDIDIFPRNNSGLPVNNYGRTWNQYFNLSLYWNADDLEAGRLYHSVLVREGIAPISMVPPSGQDRAWAAEDGFSMYQPARDSFYAFGGEDISQATVSGVDAEYSYTGEYIRPVPTLTMPNGTVLRPGIDYAFDTTLGLNRDGYVNNRHMGTASIYLVGINNYAGTKVVDFQITGTLDSSAVLRADFDGRTTYIYTGTPIRPRVTVTATYHGETIPAIEGEDYTVSYLDNIDANAARSGAPAQVVVAGKGRYDGIATFDFNINPYPLSRCDVDGTITLTGDAVSPVTPHVTVNHPEVGYTLREGVDYDVDFQGATLTRQSIIYVTGKGNYTGVRRLGFEVSSGTGGGIGGGDGTGIGSGTGSGAGPGVGNAAAGTGNTGDSSPDLQVGGGGGSGGDSPSYSLAEVLIEEVISTTVQPVEEVTHRILLPVLLVVALGAAWRYRHYRLMLGAKRES